MYKLLIVDDEPIIRQGIQRLVNFEELSISEVYVASNGSEALMKFDNFKPDIVLLDIDMPKLNGLELGRKIKNINENVLIAVITGYDYYEYAVTALKIGIDDYILKPVSKDDIQKLLCKFVNKLKLSLKKEEVNLLVEVIMKKNTITREHSYKNIMIKLIDENVSDPSFSLPFLASELNISIGYSSSLFKKLFGISFKEYVITERLETAKILLLSTDLKIYEISEKVGFEDPYYFSTAFKKRIGVSPNKYKERIKDRVLSSEGNLLINMTSSKSEKAKLLKVK